MQLTNRLWVCIIFGTVPETPKPIPLAFWRSATGREPVREWLRALSHEDKKTIGRDIAKVQFGWPVGLPLCRPLSGGLWEIRSRFQVDARRVFYLDFMKGR
jgi:phage-related protein